MSNIVVSAEAEALGQEIRRRRHELGLTLAALAARSGLTPNYIGSIEAGQRDPGVGVICKLAGGLDCKPGELLATIGAVKPPCEHNGLQRTIEGDYVCSKCNKHVPVYHA